MFHFIMALLWALNFQQPANSCDPNGNGTVVTTMDDDTGGETGHVPTRPKPKP